MMIVVVVLAAGRLSPVEAIEPVGISVRMRLKNMKSKRARSRPIY
jgi:hypothetical protein